MSDVMYIHQSYILTNPSFYEKVESMINTYLDPQRTDVQVRSLAISNASGFDFQSLSLTKRMIHLLFLTQAVFISRCKFAEC